MWKGNVNSPRAQCNGPKCNTKVNITTVIMFNFHRIFYLSMHTSMIKENTTLNKGNSQTCYKKKNKGGFNKK